VIYQEGRDPLCVNTTLLQDVRFFILLTSLDEALARETASRGCPWCRDGRLHQSNYLRKPRGGPRGVPSEVAVRFSYCCDQDGCRRRVTPASFRFLARRVYFAATFVLMSTATHGLTLHRASRLRDMTGVSLRTLKRWSSWCLETFPGTPFWRGNKAQVSPPVAEASLPQSLLARFPGEALRDRLRAALRFFLPLSTTSDPRSTGMLRG